MKILSIETSCDETAVAVVEATGGFIDSKFKILGNALYSQASKHAEYGGVYPTLAKREHSKNLVPLLQKALTEAGLFNTGSVDVNPEVDNILERETELLEQFKELIPKTAIPDIDAIAVTQGPGLEPALWVGLNFAKALSLVWNKPLVPINHMEGHILSPLFEDGVQIQFPALSLLISGGHTQLVLIKDWFDYVIIGETRDDAVGEAYDKVARMLSLPYPGGPEISRLADEARARELQTNKSLPRPMINTDDYDFSFSGLKTAVLYRIKDKELTEIKKLEIAREFEDAVVDVLVKKTKNAIENNGIKTLILGGGVIANKEIRKNMIILARDSGVNLLLPEFSMATDNAVMIAVAGYLRLIDEKVKDQQPYGVAGLSADGNLRLD